MAFVDADDYHSPQAKQQMRSGDPLSDTYRVQWLSRVADAATNARPCVLACSALGRRHRDILSCVGDAEVVLLDVNASELARRPASRQGHFAGPALLSSQLAVFEAPGPDERVLVVDGSAPLQECVARIVWLTS